jgi:hypothetical protein
VACCRGFPSCYFHTSVNVGGVAGWNINTGNDSTGSAHCWVLRRHLLLVGVFSGAASGRGPSNASRVGISVSVGVVVVVWGSGCGGVLSVA